jgi:hypothetical protein
MWVVTFVSYFWAAAASHAPKGVDEWFMMMERGRILFLGYILYSLSSHRAHTHTDVISTLCRACTFIFFSCFFKKGQKTQCAQLHKRARELEGAVTNNFTYVARQSSVFLRFFSHSWVWLLMWWLYTSISYYSYRSMWYPFRDLFLLIIFVLSI